MRRCCAMGTVATASLGLAAACVSPDDPACTVTDGADGSRTLRCGDTVVVTVGAAATGGAPDMAYELTGTSLAFPTLSVAGSLIVTRAEVDHLSFPALTVVEGRLEMMNTPVVDLDVGRLASAGELALQANRALTHLGFPALSATTGDIDISWNPALAGLDLGALTSTAGLYVSTNPLTSVVLSRLATVTGTCLVVDGQLPRLDLPALTTAYNLDVSGQAPLTALSAPALAAIGGELTISRNAVLPTLELPALTTLGKAWVTNNPALPACQVAALCERMVAAGQLAGGCTNTGNDTLTGCP